MSFLQSLLYPKIKVSDNKLEDALSKKTVLISGASFGIGRLLAEKIAFPNTKVIILGRTEEQLKEVCQIINDRGGSARYFVGDLRDKKTTKDFLDLIKNENISVDIFVNNAGKSIRRSVYESVDRFHDFTRTMDLNYYAPVELVLSLLPGLSEKKGQIINISSIIVLLPSIPLWSAYQASKGAFHIWFKSIKPELNLKGVATNNIYLPLVNTRMIAPTKKFNKLPTMNPEHAMQIISNSIVKRNYNYKPWWTVIIKPLIFLFQKPFFKATIMNSK
ncbi:MAG: epimerase [Flavobacteriales bacterium]|nr:epimerase [Flavobacteriales bacterium]|tara:strand:- start:177 stop:1001 length:825 start_codon:yes stop_codon:yes gene_type:complete